MLKQIGALLVLAVIGTNAGFTQVSGGLCRGRPRRSITELNFYDGDKDTEGSASLSECEALCNSKSRCKSFELAVQPNEAPKRKCKIYYFCCATPVDFVYAKGDDGSYSTVAEGDCKKSAPLEVIRVPTGEADPQEFCKGKCTDKSDCKHVFVDKLRRGYKCYLRSYTCNADNVNVFFYSKDGC